MFSTKQIISAMAGVAMLALPVSAFAEHHDDNWNRARGHGSAFHQARVNNQIARSAPGTPFRYGRDYDHDRWTPAGGWQGTPAQRAPLNSYRPGWHPYAWNRPPYAWNNGYPPPAYRSYAAPVYQPYAGSSSNCAQQADWLTYRRQQTMLTIAQLRARGDNRAAGRLVPFVTGYTQRINGLNNGGCGYAPRTSYAAPYSSGSYYGNSNNGGSYYGNPAYGNSTLGALSSLAPLLGGIR